MAKYKVKIINNDENFCYDIDGNFVGDCLIFPQFDFHFKGVSSLLIINKENSNSKIPLKLNNKVSFKYHTEYGELLLQSKLILLKIHDGLIEIEYELYHHEDIVNKCKITIENEDS